MRRRSFLITGASKGIGRAVAQRLVKAGHSVTGFARGPDATFPGELISVDVADVAETCRVMAELAAKRSFDGIINNVGLVKPQALEQIDVDSLDLVMRVNLYSAVLAARTFTPGMVERRWGRIVSTASLTVLGMRDRGAYAASKAALMSFTRTWALELASYGVTVNAIAPGPIETELFRANNPAGGEGEKAFVAGVPMGRLGKPDEVAAAICFLLGENAAFITGQTLFVDGGASIGRAAF